MEILNVENLSFKYPLSDESTINNVSFSVSEGEFIVLCGATGSGKTTLLRMLKKELSPLGEKSGTVKFRGKDTEALAASEAAAKIGYVMQRPEQQIVTDKVWHELAFGLENIGVPREAAARRIAETAAYFGIEEWYEKDVSLLSGGQKQLLNLAAIMVMNPDILILDEPTAQLDPVAASGFINTLKKLNRDFSLTIVIAEHRLEELIPVCDRLMIMEGGKITASGEPKSVIGGISADSEIMTAMPAAARISSLLGITPPALSVTEGRTLLREYKNEKRLLTEKGTENVSEKAVLSFRDVYFRYGRELPDILKGTSFDVYENEIFCILGGNGSGKSTALMNAAGLLRNYSGNITVFGKKIKDYKNGSLYDKCLSYLPQDVQTVFLRNTVREELDDVGADEKTMPFDMTRHCGKHPYDLSGGEQQLLALAKVLAAKPEILLLDEPTKGLDAAAKSRIADVLKKLKAGGMTIVMVTHDVEFAAVCADRCALFFRGDIVSADKPQAFFAENSFYTTAASRISRGIYEKAVTAEQVVSLCRLNGRKDGVSADND